MTKWKLAIRPPKYVELVASDPMYNGVVEFVTFDVSDPDASCTPFLKIRSVLPDRVTAKWTHSFAIDPVDAYRR